MTSTTKEILSNWFERGLSQGATHLIVVCDTFDHEDYPVFVEQGESAIGIAKEQYGYPGSKNMQKVMECYDLSASKEFQLNQNRAFNFDQPTIVDQGAASDCLPQPCSDD